MRVEFEASALVHDTPAGLEYVAAVYEEIGALADFEADPNDDALFHYWDHAAYGQAFWAHQQYTQEMRSFGIAIPV